MPTYVYHKPTGRHFPIHEAVVFFHNDTCRDPINHEFAERYGESIARVITDEEIREREEED
jgi:hypothetical protein